MPERTQAITTLCEQLTEWSGTIGPWRIHDFCPICHIQVGIGGLQHARTCPITLAHEILED